MINLWSWGANSHGQLGLKSINEKVDSPCIICPDSWKSIKQISCGGGHTLLINDERNLYSCGWNHKRQLGTNTETQSLERVWPLSGINFMNISCGWDFSCGITDDQFLFVWGSNSHGQLGLPKEHFDRCPKPFRLQIKACLVSMGLRHTALVNARNEVWVTGCGRHGQLGLGEEKLCTDRFEKIAKLPNISHLACGQNHTIAWSSDECALYVWGDNRYGQLILNSEKYPKIFVPQKIDIDVKQKVQKLLSGWTNALLWLEDGQVLTWGRNNYGQLGSKDAHPGKLCHVTLPVNRQVKDIAVGSEHTICLATDNSLWAWGWNEHSNTGTGSEDSIFEPTAVPLSNKEEIIKIYAGGGHNFMITEGPETDQSNEQEAL